MSGRSQGQGRAENYECISDTRALPGRDLLGADDVRSQAVELNSYVALSGSELQHALALERVGLVTLQVVEQDQRGFPENPSCVRCWASDMSGFVAQRKTREKV